MKIDNKNVRNSFFFQLFSSAGMTSGAKKNPIFFKFQKSDCFILKVFFEEPEKVEIQIDANRYTL